MTARIAILGASGYTGAELLRLLLRHPHVEIAALTADRKAGAEVADIYPQFFGLDLPRLTTIAELDWSGIDLAFGALPHATTQEVVAALPEHVRIVDLSADFRLRDVAAYERWYGRPHGAPELQASAVYGLPEFYRDEIASARLVANTGCYVATSLLPLVPLLQAGLIDADEIIIDAKSGVTGAGRAAKEGSLFAEVSTGIHAYGVGAHRHMAEIDQELGAAAGREVVASFTPHLVPMNRGMLATIYARAEGGAQAVHAALAERYTSEPFVGVLPFGNIPQTRHVVGSNMCRIGVATDRRPNRVIICSVLDNLMKGASGQAVQCMNIMLGLDETAGLEGIALFP